MCIRVYVHVVTCAIYMYKSEDKLWESILYFCHVGPRSQTHVIKLGNKVSLPAEPSL